MTTEATMGEPKPYQLDQHGFPAINCPKCNGGGTIAAYHNVHHGICYRCNGSKLIYPTATISRHATDYAQRLRTAGTTTPAELIAEGAALAARCRASYDRTLARRAGRPGGNLDADTRRYVAAIQNILSDDTLDETEKCVALARLRDQRRSTTASRGVRDRITRIGHDSYTNRVGPQGTLTAIAEYINSLITTTQEQ